MFFELALSFVPDFIKKGLLVLGIGWLSYASVTTLFTNVQQHLIGSYQNIPSNVLVLVNMSGIPESIGIVLGAMLARLSFVSLDSLGKVV